MMSQAEKISVPADNPEYFNSVSVRQWTLDHHHHQSSSSVNSHMNTFSPRSSDPVMVEPEVVESFRTIEKLCQEKSRSSIKSKTSKKFGSLKRLFSSGSRRNSSDLDTSETSAPPPLTSSNQYASLPSTPRRARTNLFRLSSDSMRSINKCLAQAPQSSPSHAQRAGAGAKPPRNPVKQTKPPPGVIIPSSSTSFHRIPARTRSLSSGGHQQLSTWPGMTPPFTPPLHNTCRGYRDKELPDIVILFRY